MLNQGFNSPDMGFPSFYCFLLNPYFGVNPMRYSTLLTILVIHLIIANSASQRILEPQRLLYILHNVKELILSVLHHIRETNLSNSDCGNLHLLPTFVANGSSPLRSISDIFVFPIPSCLAACSVVRNFSGCISFGCSIIKAFNCLISSLCSLTNESSILKSLSVIIRQYLN